MMTGKNNGDAASRREDSYLAGLIPQATENLAARHAAAFDAQAGQARFETWLAAHTKEPDSKTARRKIQARAFIAMLRSFLKHLRRCWNRSASDLSMAQVADELAAAVARQWDREVAVRRLNDPHPLPVSWTAADTSLTGDWKSLVKLASGGPGWPSPPPAGTWAPGPEGLAGQGRELADVLARVPTGRLVVLGEAGAGKTMLAVRLVLDLLAARTAGGPVPVLVPAASWDPSAQDLRDWLAARLITDYPALAAPGGAAGPDRAAALIEARLILPVLDGLDEIPESVRGRAVRRINDALRPGEQVVVTCRSQQYRDMVRPPGGAEVTLRGAAAIELRPLDAAVVRSYLLDDAGGPAARARWDPVLAALGTLTPAGQVLRTPLMVCLARAIYNPRPGELTGAAPDPVELLGLPDLAAVQAHLFDQFISAAYRTPAGSRRTGLQAETWLVFLARHLEHTIGTPDLAWWQLREAMPRRVLRLAAGVVFGLAAGLTAGLTAGVVFGLTAGLTAGLVSGLVSGLVFGLAGVSPDPAEATSPQAILARDRRLALILALGFGFMIGLAGGLATGLTVGLTAGLTVGLTAGLAAGQAETQWLAYMLARAWLAMRGRLPWPLMSFLADAHQRGVLRQAGATYQFRHIELQHRLADHALRGTPHAGLAAQGVGNR